MTGTVDPCPHVLPCGACIDCCERDHDHDKETGMDFGPDVAAIAAKLDELQEELARRGQSREVVVIEELNAAELSRYWRQADGKSSPAVEALRRLVWQGRDPGIPGFRFDLPGNHGKTVNPPEVDG